MSFKEKNRYFIQNAFLVGMKNLSKEDRISRYETYKYGDITIKQETRNRIYDYYSKELKINNIDLFYEEIFEFFSEYESEFLLLNLFFKETFIC